MLFDSDTLFDCGVLLPFSGGCTDDVGGNSNNNMCYFPGTRIEEEGKENVVSSDNNIIATTTCTRSSTSTSSSSSSSSNNNNNNNGVQTIAKTTKYQETHTSFGRKGCGLHKEHHLWKNCKPLPNDLSTSEILVQVIDPIVDTRIYDDDTILELATTASNILLRKLRTTYSACHHYDARFILKLKVTAISDGSINGSVSTNRPISSYGYAGIGVIWKLCSNELSGFELQHRKTIQQQQRQQKHQHQFGRGGGNGNPLLETTTTTTTENASLSSSYYSDFDSSSSYDDYDNGDDDESEIPYEPLPYDGGFEVIEQSLDYMQLFSTKSIGYDIVLKELVPDICQSIIKRIGITTTTTTTKKKKKKKNVVLLKPKPSSSSSSSCCTSSSSKSHQKKKANNNAMLRLVTNTKNKNNNKSTTTKRPLLVPSFLTECEV